MTHAQLRNAIEEGLEVAKLTIFVRSWRPDVLASDSPLTPY
jgi:hypothetical protein